VNFAGGEMLDLSQIADFIKGLAVVASVLIISYGGFVLMTSQDPNTRSEWKEILVGVFIGLSLLFIAPIIAQALSGGHYCV
jgi:hypothetical protein